MEYVQLGKSNLKVSKLCLGCMSFGKQNEYFKWDLNQEQTNEMVKKALDLGINFFDTANLYCEGTSEIYFGKCYQEICQK